MKNIISKKRFADQDIEQLIGLQLRYGVVIASLVVFIGGLLYLNVSGSALLPHYEKFLGEKAGFTTGTQIWNGTLHLNPKGIIELGVIILIATPILRILFSLIGFIIEKDRLYTIITLIVLMVMMFSTFGGLKV
jgi:uncharacterized membrane protein